MELTNQLPEEYFDRGSFNNIDMQEGNNFESLPTQILEDNAFKMPGEEAILNSSPAIPFNKPTTENLQQQTESIEQPNVQNIAQPNNTILNANQGEVLEKIKQIDDKLFDLEKKLYNVESSEQQPISVQKNTNNQFLNDTMVSREIPVDLNNPQTNQNKLQQINADFVNNDSVTNLNNTNDTNNLNTNDIVEVQNTTNSSSIKNTLIAEINNLNKIRKDLINAFKQIKNNSTNNVKTNNISDASNSFIPNLAYTTNNEFDAAADRAVTSEKIFNNNEETKIVTDSLGSPAVISKDQIDLQGAIKEHGGVEQAVKDSSEKQTFTENLYNSESKSDNISEGDMFSSTENLSTEDNVFNDSYPDSLSDITKNTGATVTAINLLSKKMSDLSNAISTGFKGLNNSIKNVETSQNSIVNNISNNNANSNNNSSAPAMSREKSTIPNVVGDNPLPQDFPAGFVPGGSNL